MADLKFKFGDNVYFKNGSKLTAVILEVFPNNEQYQYSVVKKGHVKSLYVAESEIELYTPRMFEVGDSVIIKDIGEIGEIVEIDSAEYTSTYSYLVRFMRSGKLIERFINQENLEISKTKQKETINTLEAQIKILQNKLADLRGPSALKDEISFDTFGRFSVACFGHRIAIELCDSLTPIDRPELKKKALVVNNIYDVELIKSSGYTILNITHKKQ